MKDFKKILQIIIMTVSATFAIITYAHGVFVTNNSFNEFKGVISEAVIKRLDRIEEKIDNVILNRNK